MVERPSSEGLEIRAAVVQWTTSRHPEEDTWMSGDWKSRFHDTASHRMSGSCGFDSHLLPVWTLNHITGSIASRVDKVFLFILFCF